VGLAIVAKIVNRHGGTIMAEGELGKGARFEIRLPVEPVESREIPALLAHWSSILSLIHKQGALA
jgi:nitrogen-specific signal transduction histidine kinase